MPVTVPGQKEILETALPPDPRYLPFISEEMNLIVVQNKRSLWCCWVFLQDCLKLASNICLLCI